MALRAAHPNASVMVVQRIASSQAGLPRDGEHVAEVEAAVDTLMVEDNPYSLH